MQATETCFMCLWGVMVKYYQASIKQKNRVNQFTRLTTSMQIKKY